MGKAPTLHPFLQVFNLYKPYSSPICAVICSSRDICSLSFCVNCSRLLSRSRLTSDHLFLHGRSGQKRAAGRSTAASRSCARRVLSHPRSASAAAAAATKTATETAVEL